MDGCLAIKALISDLEAGTYGRQAGSTHFQLMNVGNAIYRVASLFPFFLKQRVSVQNSKPEVRRCFVGSEKGDVVVC